MNAAGAGRSSECRRGGASSGAAWHEGRVPGGGGVPIEERARFGCARAVFTCARVSAQMRAHFVNSRSGDAHPEKASLTSKVDTRKRQV